MLTRNFAGGVSAIFLGALYIYFAYQIRVSGLDDAVGPSGLPRTYGWLMIILGAILCAQEFIFRKIDNNNKDIASEWKGQGRKILWAAGLLIFGIVYLLVIETLGYLISIALLITGVALYRGASPSLRLVAIGCVGSVILWAMFVLVLDVPMPAGLLEALRI